MITFRELKPLLVQLTADKTAATATRAAAATSLAGLCFLGGGEMAEVSFISSLSARLWTNNLQPFLNDSSMLFPSLSDRHPSNPYVSTCDNAP